MIEIKDLLAKYSNILVSGEFKKDFIRNAISSSINVDIKSEDIKIENNIIYLNIKPIYKNEILLKRDVISAKLDECFGERGPKNIR